ncbi:WS/DGAT/MGAT family O-acyltransferase [Calidifontibacter terrae]
MKQISSLDAAFLGLDNARMTGNISSLMILDPSGFDGAFDLGHIRSFIDERIPRVPMFRQRLATVPFGVDRPYWVDDDRFDLTYHVRESALPGPGTHEQLLELVARLHERPLDMHRPLWETYLISGLKGGRVAVFTKSHHVMIDGVAGMEVMSALIDPQREYTHPDRLPYRPQRPPSSAHLLARSTIGLVQRPADAWSLVSGLAAWNPLGGVIKVRNPLRGKSASGLAEVGEGLPLRTPVTSFNAAITRRRRVGIADLSLTDIRTVKNAFECSVNDVVMAVMAGAMRRWLLEDGGVTNQPLVAMVPVAVKARRSGGGNSVTAMLTTLPTHLEVPAKRLRRSKSFTSGAKKSGGALSPKVLMSALEFAPPVILGTAARAVFETGIFRAVRPFNLVISNVPGGSSTVYLAGAEVESMYPVSVVTDGLGLNITLLGYRDELHLGITSCPDLVANPQQICDWAVAELQLLLDAAAEQS